MRLIEKVDELRARLQQERLRGRQIGFVPTMGHLHEGHLSLIRRAADENDVVVISIFVNPTQFDRPEDLQSYPKDLDRDRRVASSAGVDYLFCPTEEEMYPGDHQATVSVGRLSKIVEGHFRPGHFDGVATVCAKLFHAVAECRAYFGQKDAQQLAVVRKMIRDLLLPVEIVACPTIREDDGLAASSRNVHLTDQHRRAASAIPEALRSAQDLIVAGERSGEKIRRIVEERISAEQLLELQYVAVVLPDTFEEVEEIEGPVIVAVAAFAGDTRLIDNIFLEVPYPERSRGERVAVDAREVHQ